MKRFIYVQSVSPSLVGFLEGVRTRVGNGDGFKSNPATRINKRIHGVQAALITSAFLGLERKREREREKGGKRNEEKRKGERGLLSPSPFFLYPSILVTLPCTAFKHVFTRPWCLSSRTKPKVTLLKRYQPRILERLNEEFKCISDNKRFQGQLLIMRGYCCPSFPSFSNNFGGGKFYLRNKYYFYSRQS